MTKMLKLTAVGSWLLLVAAASCSAPADPTSRALLMPRVVSPRDVVARVNGVPIVADDLRHQMRDGSDRRAALQQLIALELLAQEAQRRGLQTGVRVAEVRRTASAALLARRAIGDSYTKKSIPADLVERAYKQNLRRYVRSEIRSVVHFLAKAPRGAPPAVIERARRLAQKARAIASAGKLSPAEFRGLADLLQKAAKKAGIEIITESLATQRHGTLREFDDATFSLKRVGDISGIARTRHGFHVIYLAKISPAINHSLSEVDGEIRQRIFARAKHISFQRFIKKLRRERYPVQRYPGAIKALARRSTERGR